MHENPLLPNAKLKELYALMQRARALSRAAAGATRFEAMLAATLMQVEPGDFVSPPRNAPAAATLAAERTGHKQLAAPVPLPSQQRLAVAAGIAQGLKMAKDSRISIVFTDAGSSSVRNEAGWAEALTYAHRAELPLLLICADVERPARAANPKALTWDSMSKLAKPLRMPVLSVDGSDAIAVYRVMQESVLRARTVGGTAVIWCVLPAAGKTGPTGDPLQHMKRYLAARNLLAPAIPTKKRIR